MDSGHKVFHETDVHIKAITLESNKNLSVRHLWLHLVHQMQWLCPKKKKKEKKKESLHLVGSEKESQL